MITAIDTNIILDILIHGEPHSASSKILLERHLANGKLILCEAVFAELAAMFPTEHELRLFMAETGIRLVPSNEKSLHIAGARWVQYARRGRKDGFSCSECGKGITVVCPHCNAVVMKRQVVLSDFLIGAHALVQADCLLSRDRGIYKNNFSDLKVFSAP